MEVSENELENIERMYFMNENSRKLINLWKLFLESPSGKLFYKKI